MKIKEGIKEEEKQDDRKKGLKSKEGIKGGGGKKDETKWTEKYVRN